eukprot:1150066-Prorocentrum_lima.AAC.1
MRIRRVRKLLRKLKEARRQRSLIQKRHVQLFRRLERQQHILKEVIALLQEAIDEGASTGCPLQIPK